MTTVDPHNPLESLLENGCYFEYTKAADPLGAGAISKIPFAEFDRDLHETGGSRIIPPGCQ